MHPVSATLGSGSGHARPSLTRLVGSLAAQPPIPMAAEGVAAKAKREPRREGEQRQRKRARFKLSDSTCRVALVLQLITQTAVSHRYFS